MLASILGTMITATLGYMESDESFSQRKFVASILRALVAGIVTSLVFQSIPNVELLGFWMYVTAAMYGITGDVAVKRAYGVLKPTKK